MTRMTVAFTLIGCLLLALSPRQAAADDDAVPERKYVYCTVCHGIAMGGNHVIAAPRLSGMPAWYVEAQLLAFKSGWRGVHEQDAGGLEMRPMAAALTAAEIAEVAEYVAETESARPEVAVDGDVARGESLYQNCVACHGPDAGGNEALGGPPLTGLDDWYLVTQLKNYQAGIRGSHPDDILGQQMRAMLGVLPDEQAIADVVRYIATLESD